ncbi:DUF2470 domain-containing protein [Rhodospirillaceae bacterium SYSU D60014]|uniref:HugZ family pyridoxamine 5'-phosphate oxidase n=1 Tax=Virgifigura deserti TaxID=2268457 RepID=UPI000E65F94E
MSQDPSVGAAARHLLRDLDRATLATRLEDREADAAGWPYASLVLVAADQDGTPLLLLSDLAEHSRNIAADRRVALLFDGTGDRPDPLTGPRVTVLGTAERSTDPGQRARFLARHPSAALYAGFADFNLYRVAVSRAHMVAGFGRIDWIAREDLLFDTRATAALADRERDILDHMNTDHPDALDLIATRLLGHAGTAWRMTGIDPEGCDLRREGTVARARFATIVGDADAARAELVRLTREARSRPLP